MTIDNGYRSFDINVPRIYKNINIPKILDRYNFLHDPYTYQRLHYLGFNHQMQKLYQVVYQGDYQQARAAYQKIWKLNMHNTSYEEMYHHKLLCDPKYLSSIDNIKRAVETLLALNNAEVSLYIG